MAEIMRALHAPESTRLDYGFFAGVPGDDFVMCYSNNGVSVVTECELFLKRVLGLIGQDCTLVKNADVMADFDQTFDNIRDSLDCGIPVPAKLPAEGGNFTLITSINDENGVCYFSCGDEANYPLTKPLKETGCDLTFIDTLPNLPPEKEVYRAAVLNLPALMTAEPTSRGVYFGAAAYRRWAEDICADVTTAIPEKELRAGATGVFTSVTLPQTHVMVRLSSAGRWSRIRTSISFPG